MTYRIEQRRLVEVNTDPQRRCYNGCHFKSEMMWTDWDWIQMHVDPEKVESALAYWRELNDYSISVGGRKCEFRAVKNVPEEINK